MNSAIHDFCGYIKQNVQTFLVLSASVKNLEYQFKICDAHFLLKTIEGNSWFLS